MVVRRIHFKSGTSTVGYVFPSREEFERAVFLLREVADFLTPLLFVGAIDVEKPCLLVRANYEMQMIYVEDVEGDEVIGLSGLSQNEIKHIGKVVADGAVWYGIVVRFNTDYDLAYRRLALARIDELEAFMEHLDFLEVFLVEEDLYVFTEQPVAKEYLCSEFFFSECDGLFKERCRERGKLLKTKDIRKILSGDG